MTISSQYFKPFDSLVKGRFTEIECNPITALAIASYFTLIIPFAFFLISCLKGRVKVDAPEGSPKVAKVAQQTLNKKEADIILDEGFSYRDGSFGQSQDLVKAFECFIKAADLGSIEAHQELGYCYGMGAGTEKNIELSIKHNLIASDAGIGASSFNLGFIYQELGSEDDYKKSATFYQKAIDQGFSDAALNLAILYERGLGVEQNKNKAFELVRDISLFNGDAHVRMGIYILLGVGCEKNPELAKRILSHYKNDPIALYHLGKMHLEGFEGNKDEKLAFELLSKAKDLGNLDANILLGRMYYLGIGTLKNPNKAFECINLAYSSNQNDINALFRLAAFYMRGVGVQTNLQKARELLEKGKSTTPQSDLAFQELNLWEELQNEKDPEVLYKKGSIHNKYSDLSLAYFKKAAELGNIGAMITVGNIFSYADDIETGKKYLKQAADLGNVYALIRLAEEEEDPKAKHQLYSLAAIKGHPLAFVGLSECYDEGTGCEQDEVKALEYIKKIADADEADIKKWNQDASFYIWAAYEVGKRYENLKDYKNAFLYYNKAAEHIGAQLRLANLYRDGIGCDQNLTLACKYYKKLEDRYPVAQFERGKIMYENNETDKEKEEGLELIRNAAANESDAAIEYLKNNVKT